MEIGTSLLESDRIDMARRDSRSARQPAVKSCCCRSTAWSPKTLRPMQPPQYRCRADGIPADMAGLDIGPRSLDLFKTVPAGCTDRGLERAHGSF